MDIVGMIFQNILVIALGDLLLTILDRIPIPVPEIRLSSKEYFSSPYHSEEDSSISPPIDPSALFPPNVPKLATKSQTMAS